MAITTIKPVVVTSGISVFYRTASPTNNPTTPTILLLHGFPTSHQNRHLIPLLAQRYNVVGPDLPGFGFATVPAECNYTYTFAALSRTIGANPLEDEQAVASVDQFTHQHRSPNHSAFLDALSVQSFAVYIIFHDAPSAMYIPVPSVTSLHLGEQDDGEHSEQDGGMHSDDPASGDDLTSGEEQDGNQDGT
ncbi:hypothetical protein FB451DRAFT_1532813 [Mycena latifolia]|nr:hypothetical protein FB451DRAFT_1532813 [Mycena latifolia]